MVFTELGIVTLVNPLQPEKALLPIWVTEFGIVTLFKPLQSQKAYSPIEVTRYSVSQYLTEDGITTSPVYSSAYASYESP